MALAGWQCLLGGALIGAAALAIEPCSDATLTLLGAPEALGCLAFLEATSVIGAAVYLMLLARWEAGRVASDAHVCPLIALAEGTAIGGHLPGAGELAAVLLLLLATGCSLTAAPIEGDSR